MNSPEYIAIVGNDGVTWQRITRRLTPKRWRKPTTAHQRSAGAPRALCRGTAQVGRDADQGMKIIDRLIDRLAVRIAEEIVARQGNPIVVNNHSGRNPLHDQWDPEIQQQIFGPHE